MAGQFKPGNSAAIRNGNRTTRRGGIVLAELGKKYSAVYDSLKTMRRALESLVAGPQGQIDLLTVAKINEALRWEMTARIQQRVITDNPAMPPAEIISALNGIGNATRNRNAIMAKLLNGKTTDPAADDPWLALLDSPEATGGERSGEDDQQAMPPAIASGNATENGKDMHTTHTLPQNSTGNSGDEKNSGERQNSSFPEISFGRGGE